MSDLKFQCPHCQQHLEAPTELLGQTISCPSCQGQLQLPDPTPTAPPPPVARAVTAPPAFPRFPNASSPPALPPTSPPVPETSGLAVASMVLGIVALIVGLFVAVIPSLIAIIFGHVALTNVRKHRPLLGGKGFAVAGLTLGYISLLTSLLMFAACTACIAGIDAGARQLTTEMQRSTRSLTPPARTPQPAPTRTTPTRPTR